MVKCTVDIFFWYGQLSTFSSCQKSIASRLISYKENNNVCELFQSADIRTESQHSPGSTITSLWLLIKSSAVILVLLDLKQRLILLTAQCKLLLKLNIRFEICDKSLEWFRLYLSIRTHRASSLEDGVRAHGLNVQFYTDDTQFYHMAD